MITTARLEELKNRRDFISYELIEATIEETDELNIELDDIEEEIGVIEATLSGDIH